MYCKKCGKEIADDSNFCQYCGEALESTSTKKPKWHKLSKWDWTFILFCIGWVAYWIAESCEHYSNKVSSAYHWFSEYKYTFDKYWLDAELKSALPDSMVYFFQNAIVPLIVVIIIYIFVPTCYRKAPIYIKKYKDWKETRRKRKATKKTVRGEIANQELSIPNNTQQDIVPRKAIVKTFPLMDFAREHGNMQVAVKTNEDGTTETRCIFTNEAGVETIVDFATSLGVLTAKQISEQKFTLCVHLFSDNHYELDKL